MGKYGKYDERVDINVVMTMQGECTRPCCVKSP